MIVYCWFKGVDEDREGGPWWAFQSISPVERIEHLCRRWAVDEDPQAHVNINESGQVEPPSSLTVHSNE